MMIDKNSQNNLITWGLAFEYEDGQNPLMYNDEDIERHITSDPFVWFIPEKVIKIQWGLFFNILLTATGKVYSRGRNSFGQLGLQNSKFNSNNSTQDIKGSTIPVIIEDLIFNDDFVIDIAAGYSHCIALTFKRRIFIWGQKWNFPPNEVYEAKANQLINHQAFPKEIRGVLIHYNPQKVIAGGLFSGIITIDGKLLTFGFGENGQLGHLDHNQKPFGYLYEPKRVDFLDDYFVEDASFGNSHAFAIVRKKIKEDAISEEYKLEEQRLLFSWGENKYGQCGNGDYGNSLTPRRVKGLDDHNILQVSAGKSHTLILAEKDGSTSLYFWGDASNGSSGLTKTLKGNFSTPTIITLIDRYRKIENSEKMTDFIDIWAGFDTSFIILK